MALDSYDKIANVTQDDCQKMYPGFTVSCQKCSSTRVALRNTLGYSPESGGWGEISLECADCGNKTDIVGS